MLIKKIAWYLLKKLVDFIKFCIVFLFVVKCYYYILLSFYFLNEELYYNLSIYYLYVVLGVSIIYFRYLFSFVIDFGDVTNYYYTIYFYSVFCEIKRVGLINWIKKLKLKFINKIIKITQKYWQFRRKLSPLNSKINYTIFSIFDKYVKEKEELKKKEQENKKEKFKKKKAEAMNLTLKDFIDYMLKKNIKNWYGVSSKKKNKKKQMMNFFI